MQHARLWVRCCAVTFESASASLLQPGDDPGLLSPIGWRNGMKSVPPTFMNVCINTAMLLPFVMHSQ